MGMFTVAVIIGTQLLGLQTNTRIGSADPFCTHSVASGISPCIGIPPR